MKREATTIIEDLIQNTPRSSDWRRQVETRREEKDWLQKSAKIAIRIIRALRDSNISQVQLAEFMSVTPQHINKILKGRENMTLETICKLEVALGLELITILKSDEIVVTSQQWETVIGYHFESTTGNNLEHRYDHSDWEENNLIIAATTVPFKLVEIE